MSNPVSRWFCRCGEFLLGMEKHPPGRPTKNQLHDATNFEPTLHDLGIEKNQSVRMQCAGLVLAAKRACAHGSRGGKSDPWAGFARRQMRRMRRVC